MNLSILEAGFRFVFLQVQFQAFAAILLIHRQDLPGDYF